jgi:hypothetical protein
MAKLILIRNSDGDTHVTEIDEQAFLKDLNDGEYDADEFFDSFPTESDTNYWRKYLLLKNGVVVSPKAETVVTKYSL